MPRTVLKEFSLANPLYRGARVSFYTVVGGAKSNVLATLYRSPTGSELLANPQSLDSRGASKQPIYCDVPVVATVEGIHVPTHDTGIIQPAPTFRVNDATAAIEYSFDGGASWNSTGDFFFRNRGNWAGPGTDYQRNDIVVTGGQRYSALSDHVSTASFAADLAAGKWRVFGVVEFVANVKTYGALGDGVTNDTAAFNAAFASSLPVYVPPGTYLLNALTAITNASPLMYGEGRQSKLLFDTAGNGLDFDPGIAHQNRNLVLRDLAFDNVNNVPASFIKCTDHLNTVFERLYFSDCAATWCVDHAGSYGTRFRDCVFSDVTGGGVKLRDDGGVATFSLLTQFNGCDFTRLTGTAIDHESGAFLNLTDTVVEGCGAGVKMRSTAANLEAWNATFINAYFESNTGDDISMPSDVNYWCTLTLISCTLVGAPNISLGAKSKLTAIGCNNSGGNVCTVTGSANAGVDLYNCGSGSFVQSGAFRWNDFLQAPLFYNVAWSGAGTQSLGINVNAGGGGRVFLLMISRQSGAGNSVAAIAYMVRCGFDGDNYTVTTLASDVGGTGGGGNNYTFSLVASVLQVTGVSGGNYNAQIMANR